jgi:hypothetical protein
MSNKVNQATKDFISINSSGDVRLLALKADKYPDVDIKYALVQIEGRQKACRKLPRMAAVEGIIYPQHLSMEQCSSELTANYKAEIAKRLVPDMANMVDLTGGFGIDCYYIGRQFKSVVYVERQEELCNAVKNNFPLLDFCQAEVICGDGMEYLNNLHHVNLIYIDPARRDNNGGRTFAISDCTPNVVQSEAILVDKSDMVMIKLSPMLDWHQVVSELKYTSEIHIVSIGNECREMIAVLHGHADGMVNVYCCNDNNVFSFCSGEEKTPPPLASLSDAVYLYEPNSSLMKAGCFGLLTQRYALKSVAANSHLLVSDKMVNDFPGRKFLIKSVFAPNKREIKIHLQNIKQANIAVRNYPLSAVELRKRLKLKDGGDVYLFATTLADGTYRIFHCVKCSNLT